MPLLPALAFAAALARAEPPRLDPARLATGTDSLRVYVLRGADTVASGIQHEHLAREGRGRAALLIRRVATTVTGALTLADSTETRDDAATLRPRAHRAKVSGALEAFDATPARVTGTVTTREGGAARLDLRLRAPAWNSASLDLLLRAADLAEGAEWRVPLVSPAAGDVVEAVVRVAARERVDDRDCWRVETDVAGLPIAFWIDVESRRLRRQLILRGRGVRILLVRVPAA